MAFPGVSWACRHALGSTVSPEPLLPLLLPLLSSRDTCMTDVHFYRPPMRHKIVSRHQGAHKAIQKRGQVLHRVLCIFNFVSKSRNLGHCTDGGPHKISPQRYHHRRLDSLFLSVNLWTILRVERSLPKQNGMTASALGITLCLLTRVQESQGPGSPCSHQGFTEGSGSPAALPALSGMCVCVLCPPHSYWPAVLAGHQADGDSVWELPAAALLPDPVQRGERRGLPGPCRALGHHQLPHLQVCFTSCAENRRGPPF